MLTPVDPNATNGEGKELSPEELDPSNGLPAVDLGDLPQEVERVIRELNKTPLIIDTSPEQGTRTFYSYKAMLEVS
jgi:hypothetical protein